MVSKQQQQAHEKKAEGVSTDGRVVVDAKPETARAELPAVRVNTRPQAVALAKRLRREGRTFSQIAQALTDAGWKSSKGGPATLGGVQSLLGARESVDPPWRRTGKQTRTTSAKPSTDEQVLDIVHRILLQAQMPAEERIAASTLIIEGMRGTPQ